MQVDFFFFVGPLMVRLLGKYVQAFPTLKSRFLVAAGVESCYNDHKRRAKAGVSPPRFDPASPPTAAQPKVGSHRIVRSLDWFTVNSYEWRQ